MIKKMSPSESDFDIPAKNCYRMVILGSTKVGKTAIVSRFLNGRFDEQYTPTIEDFHRKLYSIKGDVYQLDILDTSGNHPFPAMRRLSILTGTYLHNVSLCFFMKNSHREPESNDDGAKVHFKCCKHEVHVRAVPLERRVHQCMLCCRVTSLTLCVHRKQVNQTSFSPSR